MRFRLYVRRPEQPGLAVKRSVRGEDFQAARSLRSSWLDSRTSFSDAGYELTLRQGQAEIALQWRQSGGVAGWKMNKNYSPESRELLLAGPSRVPSICRPHLKRSIKTARPEIQRQHPKPQRIAAMPGPG